MSQSDTPTSLTIHSADCSPYQKASSQHGFSKRVRYMIQRDRVVLVLTAALLTAASGCSGVTSAPALSGALSTDASAYVAVPQPAHPNSYQFTVVARFRNTGDTPAHLGRCFPDSPVPIFGISLVASSNGETMSGYNGALACVGHDNPIVVAPGETRVDTLVIAGPTVWDGRTHQPLGTLEGTFQLQYVGDACNASNGCRSDPFTVRLGQ
jgi:hypothetical protein